MPIVANAAKDAKSPVLNVPATPGGWTFFDQALFRDAQANAAGLMTSWSSEWYVSLGSMVTGATAYAITSLPAVCPSANCSSACAASSSG